MKAIKIKDNTIAKLYIIILIVSGFLFVCYNFGKVIGHILAEIVYWIV